MSNFLKGVCYAPFPQDYNPSTANHTCIFFGSDIASYNLKPLWGISFSPTDGPDKNQVFPGRNDLANLKNMGTNLIRLYDWDSRNDHLPFLDYCYSLGIQVLVPVSNYNLGAYGIPPDIDTSINELIRSFSVKKGTDYHPAIYGIVIGCELDLPSKMPKGYLVEYTKRWVEIEEQFYSKHRKLPIGHPTSFSTHKKVYPCFKYWDEIIPVLKGIKTRDLDKRLILCPQTYNDAVYLYENAENQRKGWVDIAYDRYQLPILFCEIGCSRFTTDGYVNIIAAQLEEGWMYHQNNPEKLLGVCYFQYCDKVWIPNTSEGSFGMMYNTANVTHTVRYGVKDFSHTDGNNCTNQLLKIQVLKANPVYNTIKLIYSCIK